jgi:hypothetical protein
MSANDPPWEPPITGTESEHLFGMLERLRATFRWKADGLDADQLRARIPSSELSLGGLLKHLAVAEDDIFCWRIGGQRPVTMFLAPEGADLEEWQFTLGADETAADAYRLWDDAVARSRATTAELLAGGRLDTPGALEYGGVHPNVRRHVCDLIEEYGRHTGHADLLREAVDGLVGEDPPSDWRPTPPEN